MSNPKRRESDGSLIADLRRRVSWLEQRRTPAGAKKLDDLSDVAVPTPATNDVLTYTGSVWTSLPSVAGDNAVTQALASYTDDGLFDEISPFDWESPGFIVAANSYQPVFITVDVSVSDTVIGAVDATGSESGVGFDVGFPTPWKVEAIDTTNDVGGNTKTMGNGSGSCGCTFPIWLHNDTDTEASLTITLQVSGVSTSFVSDGFDGTVDVRAESVFQMAAIP